MDEPQEWGGVLGDAKVRPCCEVELLDDSLVRLLLAVLLEGEGADGVV